MRTSHNSGFSTEKQSIEGAETDFTGSFYATPFILRRDTTNRHKVDELIPKSLPQD